MNKIKEEKKFTCPICSTIIINKKANFLRHLALHENQHDRLKCPLCEKTVQSKGNLKIHLKNIHKVENIEQFGSITTTSEKPKSLCHSLLNLLEF